MQINHGFVYNAPKNIFLFTNINNSPLSSGGSRTAATSKIERFVIIVNGCKPLTIINKCSILDVAAVLDPHLLSIAVTNRLFMVTT